MEYKTYEEIKKIVGDGWAFIANPNRTEGDFNFTEGILLYHNSNKEKVYEESMKKEFQNYKHITILYFGERPKDLVWIL